MAIFRSKDFDLKYFIIIIIICSLDLDLVSCRILRSIWLDQMDCLKRQCDAFLIMTSCSTGETVAITSSTMTH